MRGDAAAHRGRGAIGAAERAGDAVDEMAFCRMHRLGRRMAELEARRVIGDRGDDVVHGGTSRLDHIGEAKLRARRRFGRMAPPDVGRKPGVVAPGPWAALGPAAGKRPDRAENDS